MPTGYIGFGLAVFDWAAMLARYRPLNCGFIDR
jgi:hypothetical protein